MIYNNYYKNESAKLNVTTELENLLTDTANNEGDAASKLGHCVNLVDSTKKTCCNSKWTQVIRYTIDRYIMESSKKRPAIFNLIDDFRLKLESNNCLTTSDARELS